jgi:hypothetical protein
VCECGKEQGDRETGRQGDRETDSRQQTADSRQQTADSRQQGDRETDSRQQTADSRQQTADSRQQTADLSDLGHDAEDLPGVAVVKFYLWCYTVIALL